MIGPNNQQWEYGQPSYTVVESRQLFGEKQQNVRSHIMQNPTSVSPVPAPVLSIVNDSVITTSREIARVFEKLHKNVLRDIRELEIPNDFIRLNFEPNKISVLNNPLGEETESYNITKKGFFLLAMGFTGAKAIKFKIAYIEAFERMEAELTRQPQLPEATLSPEQQRRAQNAVTDNVYTFIAPGRRRSAGFAEIYRRVKDHFLVGSYKDVPARRYEELLTFIERLDISKVKLLEEPTPIDEAAIAVRITAEIMKRLPAIAKPAPAPADTQSSWKQLWPMLEQSTDTLGAAIQQLLKEVTALIPGGLKNIPAGSDPMTYIRLHYSEMEKAARQLCILAELLMWRSPKTLNFHAALGDPRY